jgi:hypothetical protein
MERFAIADAKTGAVRMYIVGRHKKNGTNNGKIMCGLSAKQTSNYIGYMTKVAYSIN